MAGVGSKYVQLLMNRGGPGVNNGTHAGGLAHVLQQGMAAYMMGKDKRDQTEASRAMAAGMRPAESAGTVEGFDARAQFPNMPESMGEGIVETPGLKAGEAVPGTGGFKGGLAALLSPGMANNTHAGKLAQDLLLKDAERQQMVDLLNLKGAQAKDLRMSPKWQGDPTVIREYDGAVERGFNGSLADFLGMRKTSISGPTAPIQNIEHRNKLVSEYGEDSPEVSQFDNYVRAIPYLNRGDALVRPDMGRPGEIKGEIKKQLPPEKTPKAVADRAAAAASGKAQGEAQAELGSVLERGENTIRLIDEAIAHPGLSGFIGMPDGTEFIPGSASADFRARYNQLKGTVFLDAYQMLKGGGPITEIEGEQARNAQARMDRAQSEGEFIKALEDFKVAVKRGMLKMQNKANPSSAGPDGSGGWTITPIQ